MSKLRNIFEKMTYSPIKSKFPIVQNHLDNFFDEEVKSYHRTADGITKIKTKLIFFNFVQKYGTYQSHVFDAFIEWVSKNEYFEFAE